MAKPRLHRHHIIYKPEITVGIRGDAHRVLTTIQRSRGNIEQINWIKDFILSLAYEVIRMEGEVQNNVDLRQPRFKLGNKKAKVAGGDY